MYAVIVTFSNVNLRPSEATSITYGNISKVTSSFGYNSDDT